MKKISWRHHYLPVFYLKGFTNENNKFLIFDKEQGKFIKNGKEFAPSSYFFKKNANTLINGNEKDDFLETRSFGSIDNKVSKLFELIQSSNSENKFSLTEKNMPLLQNFVNLIYWRLPHRKKDLEEYLQKEGLKGFGIFAQNSDGTIDENTIEYEKKMKNDSEFKKNLGYLMSMVDTVKMINCSTPLTIQPIIKGLPYVCSDNPVLFENENKPKVYEDNFIFPLSGNMLFIRANRTSKYNMLFKIMVDTLTFKQAIKYVSFSDESYFHHLNEFYENNFTSTSQLRKTIFNYIKDND